MVSCFCFLFIFFLLLVFHRKHYDWPKFAEHSWQATDFTFLQLSICRSIWDSAYSTHHMKSNSRWDDLVHRDTLTCTHTHSLALISALKWKLAPFNRFSPIYSLCEIPIVTRFRILGGHSHGTSQLAQKLQWTSHWNWFFHIHRIGIAPIFIDTNFT